MDPIRVLFIDNFDSFTYNLVDEFAEITGDSRIFRAFIPS